MTGRAKRWATPPRAGARLAAVLMLVAAGGCGEEASSRRLGRQAEPVVNGTPTVGTEDHGVVWVINPTADDRLASCSGTLIHPRVVLTAAHCFDFNFVHSIERVAFGAAPDRTQDYIDTVHVHRNPGFSGDRFDIFANDVALVVLAHDAPPPARPWSLLPSSLAGQLAGRDGRVVGYGITSGDGHDLGVKHRGQVVIEAVSDTTIRVGQNPGGACGGDSGGPLFTTIDGTEYLTGVVSTGDTGCAGEQSTFTRVDAFFDDFIGPFLNRIATGSRTLGERCYFDGNCGEGTCTSSEARENVKYCSRSCTSDIDCSGGMLCRGVAGQRMCHYPRVHPEVLSGIICAGNSFCETNRCSRVVPGGTRICTISCTPSEQDPCPAGHACLPDLTNGGTVCLKSSAPPPGGGCSAAGGSPGTESILLYLALFFVLVPSRWRWPLP